MASKIQRDAAEKFLSVIKGDAASTSALEAAVVRYDLFLKLLAADPSERLCPPPGAGLVGPFGLG